MINDVYGAGGRAGGPLPDRGAVGRIASGGCGRRVLPFGRNLAKVLSDGRFRSLERGDTRANLI